MQAHSEKLVDKDNTLHTVLTSKLPDKASGSSKNTQHPSKGIAISMFNYIAHTLSLQKEKYSTARDHLSLTCMEQASVSLTL